MINYFFRCLDIPSSCLEIATKSNIDLAGYAFECPVEQLRQVRIVRIGLVQFHIPLPTTAPVHEQRSALHILAEKYIKMAAEMNVNIICFQEAWSKTYTHDFLERK